MIQDVNAYRVEMRAKIRELARNDFYAFYRFTFPVLAPEATFQDAFHFRALAEAMNKVVTGETPRLLIAVPPRHGKSRLGSVALPAWILGRQPMAKIICASYGDDLSKDFSRRTRELLISPAYQAIFPETLLDKGGTALDELRTTLKGYRLATSTGGVVTGKGANYIIIDDPMKAVDAASESARNSVYDRFKTSLMSRFDKPSDGRMIVLMQRLHMDDLIGRLKDEGGWTLLEMPGEGLVTKEFDIGQNEIWEMQPGELLYPEMFTHADLKQQRFDLGEAAYNAQILQQPVPPGGTLFKLKLFQRYELPLPQFEAIVQCWDPAMIDSETAAFSVCTTWGVTGRRVYLLDVFRKRLEFHQVAPAIRSLKDKYNAHFVILEITGLGTPIGNQLCNPRPKWLLTVDPDMGKNERAIAQTPKIERKRVFLPKSAPWLATFEAEVAAFPFCKYFDQVDSMVHFLSAFDTRNNFTRCLSSISHFPKVPLL